MDTKKMKAQCERLRAINEEIAMTKVTKSFHYTKQYTRYFSSVEEDELYYSIGLIEQTVNKRSCLVQPKVSLGTVDAKGQTNQERMRNGLAPVLSDNIHKPIHLHHIQQKYDGPFAELTMAEHMNNYKLLHPMSRDVESWRNNKRLLDNFNRQKERHWQTRERLIYANKIPK